jgi:hypothetical protein
MPATDTALAAISLRPGQVITLSGKTGPVRKVIRTTCNGIHVPRGHVVVIWTYRGVEFSRAVPAGIFIAVTA